MPEDPRWRTNHRLSRYEVLADHELVTDPRLGFERDFIQAGSADVLSGEELFYRNIWLCKGRNINTC